MESIVTRRFRTSGLDIARSQISACFLSKSLKPQRSQRGSQRSAKQFFLANLCADFVVLSRLVLEAAVGKSPSVHNNHRLHLAKSPVAYPAYHHQRPRPPKGP